jgi:hypothetical protein
MIENRLMAVATCLLAVFLIAATLLPIEVIRLGSAAMLTTFSTLIAFIWTPDAVRVVREGGIDPARAALIGVTMVGGGASWLGMHSIIYNALSRPDWMVGYPFYAFGQLVMAFGFFLLCVNPERRAPLFYTHRMWAIVLFSITLVSIGFMIGFAVSSDASEITYW